MWRQVSERLSSWKEIFWGKALLIGGTLWAILGAWDLFKSEILPERYQSWTLIAKTPHLSWTMWAIALLAILLGVLLEGSHSALQKRNKASAALQAEMTRQTLAASSKTTMNRDWPGDWKLAEDGFRRYEKSSVRADWFQSSDGPVEKWTLGGDNADAVHDCEALCLQAGKLLVVSPMSSHLSGEVRSHKNDADRWLYFLKERYGLRGVMNGTGISNGQSHTSTAGSIRDLAAASARACIECGAKSFPS
jgi:type II secretory pathway pseudopilin PulG